MTSAPLDAPAKGANKLNSTEDIVTETNSALLGTKDTQSHRESVLDARAINKGYVISMVFTISLGFFQFGTCSIIYNNRISTCGLNYTCCVLAAA